MKRNMTQAEQFDLIWDFLDFINTEKEFSLTGGRWGNEGISNNKLGEWVREFIQKEEGEAD